MIISSLRTLARRAAVDHRPHWRSAASGVSVESQFLQQCRGYYSRFHNKQLNPTTRVSTAQFFLRKSYSSSSSSDSKVGFLAWYLGMLESRPVLTKSVSSALIYFAADSTSQMITMSDSDSGSLDIIRMLRMASFGLIILGPAQHVWFNFMGRILPRRDVVSTLKKLAMGQLVLGPFVTGTFFSFNAALQGESGKEIVARLKRDLLPTLISGLMYWPLCDFLTYKVIPVHLQPLMNSSCAYLWTIYLTYMASLKKAVTN